MEDGELTATIQEHRNREMKFFKEEELHQILHRFNQVNAIYTYSQKYNTILYQRYI